MPKVETVTVKSDAHPSGYITVNKDDADKYEPKQESKTQARSKKAQH